MADICNEGTEVEDMNIREWKIALSEIIYVSLNPNWFPLLEPRSYHPAKTCDNHLQDKSKLMLGLLVCSWEDRRGEIR